MSREREGWRIDAPVVVFCNHKGGVAKTTTAVSIAETAVREFGIPRVLLVDCDSQGNASEALSPTDVTELVGLDACLADPTLTEECVCPSWFEGVDFLPANTRLEAPIPMMINENSGIEAIPPAYRTSLPTVGKIISRISSNYDLILVDTAPNLAPLTQSAIFSSSHVMIPCSPVKHAVFGMPAMYDTIRAIRSDEPPVNVIITMHDKRSQYERVAVRRLETAFRTIGTVGRNSRLAENISKHSYVLSRMDSERASSIVAVSKALLDVVRNGSERKV